MKIKRLFIAIALVMAISTALLLASCSALPVTCAIKFDSDGGNNVDIQQVNIGDKLPKPADPVKEGFTFEGWYNGDVLWNFEIDPVLSNMTLKAKWSANKYTAKFFIDGVLTEEIIFTLADNDTLPAPQIPPKQGYNHKWSDLKAKAEDMEIHAVYTPIPYKIVFKYEREWTNPNPITYTIDSPELILQPLTTPDPKGVTFEGWYNNGNLVTVINANNINDYIYDNPDDDPEKVNIIILDATWSDNHKPVTYKDYLNMTSTEKLDFYYTFADPQDFYTWRSEAKAKYEEELDRETVGDKPVEIG